jgi:hypothetical protein
VSQNHNGWKRGIRIGRVKDGKDGKIVAFIPDPETRSRAADNFFGTSAAEGVAVDMLGNVYGGEVGPRQLAKHIRECSREAPCPPESHVTGGLWQRRPVTMPR